LCQATKQQYKQLLTPFLKNFAFDGQKSEEKSDFFRKSDFVLSINAFKFTLARQTLKIIDFEEKIILDIFISF
jgi:hypothetical protein